jgi:hypothetical protein
MKNINNIINVERLVWNVLGLFTTYIVGIAQSV